MDSLGSRYPVRQPFNSVSLVVPPDLELLLPKTSHQPAGLTEVGQLASEL